MSVELKRAAAAAAVEHVEAGMRLGIGTGSTADEFTKALGARVAAGLDIIGVPTSEKTAELAGSLGIRLATLDETPVLDLTVDGADELDRDLQMIKGGGGALLREKIVAAASAKVVIIADDSKLVETLGQFPLPIEVVPFGLTATRNAISAVATSLGLAGEIKLRGGDTPFLTDGGHYILDASFGRIPDAKALASGLSEIPGVVEHGIFIGLASIALIAGPDGITVLSA
ncbi:MAG: ribose-5-phosphate isomerase RpiA [Hyphomicrobiales bacterium]|nr:ribose-5-phosphate isomerase RpiA [Hyphomicrobiales bacterium]